MISGISGMYSSLDMLSMYAANRTGGNPVEKFDSDGDGALNKEEFSALLGDFAEKTGNTIDADSAFSTLDADGNGIIDAGESKGIGDLLISYDESAAAEEAGTEQTSLFEVLLEQFDEDQDGALNKEELTSLLADYTEKTGNVIDTEQVISDLDTDEDGLVSKIELEGLGELLSSAESSGTSGKMMGPPPGGPAGTEDDEDEDEENIYTLLSGDENIDTLYEYLMSCYEAQMSFGSTESLTSTVDLLG